MSEPLSKNRSLAELGALYAKGIAMGMGDSVPGISGGTIAVITGIYEELIRSIGRINLSAVILLVSGDIRRCWTQVNGSFLLVLTAGVLTGLLISANSVLFLLDSYFEALMGFFIGLVLASTVYLKTEFTWRSLGNSLGFLLGIGLVLAISLLPHQQASIGLINVFFYGAIAICAMILPGLSGAFVLLVLGVYEFILGALTEFQIVYILCFGAGCLFGLLAFARCLNWVLGRHRQLTYSFLTGMLIGSIFTLWPWQQVITANSEIGSEGHAVSVSRLSPLQYFNLTDKDPQLLITLMCLLVGAAVVFMAHRLADNSISEKVEP